MCGGRGPGEGRAPYGAVLPQTLGNLLDSSRPRLVVWETEMTQRDVLASVCNGSPGRWSGPAGRLRSPVGTCTVERGQEVAPGAGLCLERHLTDPLPGRRSKAEMPYIMVQNYMTPPEGVSNDVPFSWRIRDYLEELRVQAQYVTGAEGEPPRMP